MVKVTPLLNEFPFPIIEIVYYYDSTNCFYIEYIIRCTVK